MPFTKYVAYYRVSTARQGRSGFGLDAQREAIREHVAATSGELRGEHIEVESGRSTDRAELNKALAACRVQRATLIIAKLDRLSRNVAFVSTLVESGADLLPAICQPRTDLPSTCLPPWPKTRRA